MASIIHKSIDRNRANVVAPLVGPADLEALAGPVDLALACDILELRLDAFPEPSGIFARAPQLAGALPLLATARHPAEGGANNLGTAARSALLERSLAFAAALDIEIRSLPEMSGIATLARKAGTLVVGSFHDFEATPDADVLGDMVRRGLDLGAGAIKIATRLHGPRDLFRIIGVLEEFGPDVPVSVMGMGPLGKVSRLLAAQCGSFLNYGYLFAPNASGQWPARQLRDLIAEGTPGTLSPAIA